MMKLRHYLTLVCVSALFGVSGCSTVFENSKVDYKSQSKQGPGLEVPPDLSQLNKDNRAAVPQGGAANASALQSGTAPTPTAQVGTVGLNAMGDVRVQRDGTQRWLLVGRSPDALWDSVKSFWVDNGFVLAIDQPVAGILETDWAENRAKLPQDWFRRTLGKVFEGLYSTNERDKFRTRMERTAEGGTEIYISHRGLTEDFVTSDRAQFKWKARPVDPELETEFLKRLMIHLGGKPELAPQLSAKAATVVARAQIVQDKNQISLLMTDSLDQAWRRVGLSLDRTSFTVEDRDRSKGLFFVRYVETDPAKSQPGFWSRLFGAKAKPSMDKFQIMLTAEADKTRVKVADPKGQVLNGSEAQTILKVLTQDLQ